MFLQTAAGEHKYVRKQCISRRPRTACPLTHVRIHSHLTHRFELGEQRIDIGFGLTRSVFGVFQVSFGFAVVKGLKNLLLDLCLQLAASPGTEASR